MVESIESLINKQVDELKSKTNNYEKLNIIFNLIELRHNSGNEKYKQELFLDIKKMIFYYVGAVDESYYGYYEINNKNSEKVLAKIEYLNVEEQINLIELLQRKLKLAGFVEESEYFDERLDSLQIDNLLKKRGIKNIFKAIGVFSTKNTMTLIASILVIYIFYSIILLPAPYKFMEVFQIKYVTYSSNFVTNHFLNSILSFSQIESDFSIMPKGFLGVILLIVIKISILVLLFNFLITELKRKFKF